MHLVLKFILMVFTPTYTPIHPYTPTSLTFLLLLFQLVWEQFFVCSIGIFLLPGSDITGLMTSQDKLEKISPNIIM